MTAAQVVRGSPREMLGCGCCCNVNDEGGREGELGGREVGHAHTHTHARARVERQEGESSRSKSNSRGEKVCFGPLLKNL